jgi:peptide/nickel transport system substrate-binding protein
MDRRHDRTASGKWLRALPGSLLLLTLIVSGCGLTAVRPAAKTAGTSGTATFALPQDITPDYIFPLAPGADLTNANIYQFQYLMYRPLYWYGDGASPTVNYNLSLAQKPVFSDDDQVVTVTLKHYMWSDGQPLTTRDVRFWLNELIADKTDWGAYVPGDFPDIIKAMSFPSQYKFVLTLNRSYNPNWVLYDEFSQIIPIPQHVWDKTSATSPVGNYDESTSGAVRVYSYLASQAGILSKYGSNPLWKVVDGPWVLHNYAPSTGFTELYANPSYSGPGKSKIHTFEEIPFTNDSAEFDALRAGTVDYGYLPLQDLSQRKYFTSRGYTFAPWTPWGINFTAYNYTNPIAGPIFSQLYVRQAIQDLVNQREYIKQLLHGYGYPTYGPIPLKPASPYTTAYEAENHYPYSVSKAKLLLTRHGWHISPHGTSYCASPGTGAKNCGAGIKKGAKLSFTLQYDAGSVLEMTEMEAFQSSVSAVGIQLTLTGAPQGTVIDTYQTCSASQPAGCSWDIKSPSLGAYAWTFSPDYYPTGDQIFETGAGFNGGGFSNAVNNGNIVATQRNPGSEPLYTYEDYLAKELPVIWMPTSYYQLSVISPKLHGVLPQDPNLNIYPQDWSLSS